jgi:AICAR transformylase/IMP cyclohydrolase PurH
MATKQPKWAIRVTPENAAELEAWRIQQPEALCVNDYILTNSVKDNIRTVYLLSSHYDYSYQFWGHPLDEAHAEVDQIINLEEWRAITSKSKTTKSKSMPTQLTTSITREAFESIYNVACSTWQGKLESFVADQGLFKKEYTLTEKQVDEMFKASNIGQKAVLVKAGLKQSGPAKIDLTKKIVISPDGLQTHNPLWIMGLQGSDQMISVRFSVDDKYDGNCYFLSNRFDWTIEQDRSNTVLVPKFKG